MGVGSCQFGGAGRGARNHGWEDGQLLDTPKKSLSGATSRCNAADGGEPVQRPSSGRLSHLAKGSKCRSPRAVRARPVEVYRLYRSGCPPSLDPTAGRTACRDGIWKPSDSAKASGVLVRTRGRIVYPSSSAAARPGPAKYEDGREGRARTKEDDGEARRIGGDLQAVAVSTVGKYSPTKDRLYSGMW